MELDIRAVLETNGKGYLLYAEDYPGAFVRGETLEAAMKKWDGEMAAYLRWRDGTAPADLCCRAVVIQEKQGDLDIQDADSDVLFDSERLPLGPEAYEALRELCLRSAADFLALYEGIPDKGSSPLPHRRTFYGPVPRTAEEMYTHTKNVNSYYFAEIGVEVGNEPDILACRREGFLLLERQEDFLGNPVFEGSYGEEWSLRKVLRRFLWHDRIHAKAMVRMAAQQWGEVVDPFRFLK